MNVLALIPARAGSKGVPQKNIALLAGKPLLAYAIEVVQGIEDIKDIIVSTDSLKIANIAIEYGARVPFLRPADIAQDTSRTFPVVEHALTWLHENEEKTYDYLLLVQPTSPLRNKEDVRNALKLLDDNQITADSVVSVCKIEDPHPYKIKKIERGYVVPFIDTINPTSAFRRQDLPPAYFLNGALYLCKIPELIKCKSLLGAKTLPYVMPIERSINIDAPVDLEIAEQFMRRIPSCEQ